MKIMQLIILSLSHRDRIFYALQYTLSLTLFREIILVYKQHVFRRSQHRFILIQNTCSGVYCENNGNCINMAYCQNVGCKNCTNL